ncbi:MAG: hypothetical protein RIR70_361 [Pseudomonadota bacterium]|jgi:type III secretion protein U
MSDTAEKTELPTPKKLRDARKKGQVAISKDVTHVLTLGFAFSVLFFDLAGGREIISGLFDVAFQRMNKPFDAALLELLQKSVISLWDGLWPFLLAAVIGVLAGSWSQIGFLFAPEAVKPSFQKMNPVSNVKNMLSLRSLSQLAMAMLKIAVISCLSYWVIKGFLGTLFLVPQSGIEGVLHVAGQLFRWFFYLTLFCFLVLAGLDYAVTRHFHIKQLKMSKDEVFREYKEQEGDPHLKGHLKSMRRSLVEASPNGLISRAKAVVANPTHIAVLLDYEPGEHDLPLVLGMYEDDEAQEVLALARERYVPIIRHIRLARGLYASANPNEYIPREYIAATAAVFRTVLGWASQDPHTRLNRPEWVMNDE